MTTTSKLLSATAESGTSRVCDDHDVSATLDAHGLRRLMTSWATGVAVVAFLTWAPAPTAVAWIGWALAGLGVGMVYPTLSLLVFEIARPGEQGAGMSALQTSDALSTAFALALAGALIGWLHAEAARRSAGERARAVVRNGLGAADRSARLVETLLERARPERPVA